MDGSYDSIAMVTTDDSHPQRNAVYNHYKEYVNNEQNIVHHVFHAVKKKKGAGSSSFQNPV